MRINTNTAALNSYNQLKNTENNMNKSLERLSSGKRINRAADDAAGLAISEKMKGQMNGLAQAQRNAQDGISMMQTAEGALNESQSILQRMRELSVQSANDSNTNEDRAEIQKEVDQLSQELTRIGETTEFNTQNLLDGGFEGKFQIGANEGQNMTTKINDMRADALGVASAEGIDHEVSNTSTQTLSGTGDAFYSQNTTYNLDVTSLDEKTTVTSTNTGDIEANYSLKNDSGQHVAVSSDGKDYTMLDSAVDDISNATTAEDSSSNAVAVNMNDPMTSGTAELDVADTALTSSHDITLTGTTSISFEDTELKSGEYSVVGTEHGEISSGLGLTNNEGDVVATTTDTSTTQTWSAYEDSTSTVFTIEGDAGNELAAGDSISVSGDGGVDISTQSAANDAISTVDNALNKVSQERSKLGAQQNRLDHTINNLSTAEQNLTSANSRISDVDMAKEMMSMSKNRILKQAGTAMLAQANQKSQGVMQLLG
ncbi:flagellin N-terminal helical domain-containing protein [Halanaerobaculum tunisiense]